MARTFLGLWCLGKVAAISSAICNTLHITSLLTIRLDGLLTMPGRESVPHTGVRLYLQLALQIIRRHSQDKGRQKARQRKLPRGRPLQVTPFQALNRPCFAMQNVNEADPARDYRSLLAYCLFVACGIRTAQLSVSFSGRTKSCTAQ